jgi:outer membrane protein assembly factor BamD (BamD/ComL family)
MRNLIGAVAVVAVILTAQTGLTDVKWIEQRAYDGILKRAKSENKYIMIDFYTVWCGPCKQLDKDTYTDAKVAAFLNDMIPVKYDSEQGAGIGVSKKYRVNTWPTMMLIGPDGKEIGRHIGFLDAKDFLQVMSDYKRGIGTIAYYEEKIKENPNDPAIWKTLGSKYADARYADKATKALNRFLELAPNPTADETAEVLYTIGEVNYDTKSYEAAVEFFEKVIKDYSDTEYLDSATTRLAKSYHKVGQTDRCIETYLAYVNRHPDDPKALNSFAWFCASRQVGLDEALPIALKAAKLTERDPGYLDTLAELYYARGEYDLAIEIGEEAAKADPSDKYFADQVKKFKKAKAEATRAGE